VVGLPVAGACIVIAARRLLPGDGGHAPLVGIGGGTTPVEYVPGRRRCSPRPRHGWRCASSTRARANK
jgi:hypothetical protein